MCRDLVTHSILYKYLQKKTQVHDLLLVNQCVNLLLGIFLYGNHLGHPLLCIRRKTKLGYYKLRHTIFRISALKSSPNSNLNTFKI